MKLKVKIAGPKVHDVGYRYFLMSNAIDLGLKGFHARNKTEAPGQEVIILVEGNEEAIADFRRLAESMKPPHAEVSEVTTEHYEGDVMRTGEYAQVCTALQINKAIPLLLDMRNDLKEMKADQKEMKADQKEMKADQKEMMADLKAAKGNTDTIPQILEEIKGLKEDIQPGYAIQFKHVQADVRAIKERLGML